MWLLLSLLSAFFLGMYDVSKKGAVNGNAVFPVLFFSTLSATLFAFPALILSKINPILAQKIHFFIPNLPLTVHLLIVAKSAIVGTSWVLSYFGLKNLPITIASPLRATAPFFTVLGAITLFGERPAINQWIGIILILSAYLLYSNSSKKDGAMKAQAVWIIFMILSAVTGAISAGFDKYLLQIRSVPPLFVLFWFLFYLTLIYGLIVMVFWFPKRTVITRFAFRPSIVLVGLLLVIADIAYMTALSDTNAKLALVSSIRRTNVLVSFVGGVFLFREVNIRRKLLPFAGIIAGLVLIMI
ncbi:MAG TPA: EamA family transporter [Chitinispirillaceae bacterium]|nr:EamA family transporter [Chitinispirillaceae bacterium]